MRKYFNYQVKKTVIVQNLITIEAIETSPTFSYPEEKHEFYEVVYTDSGTINCAFNDKLINLKQGDLLLIPPKTVHSYKAIIDKSASIFIVCFRCTSDFLNIFENKIKLSNDQKSLLAEIIKEAKSAFHFPFNKKLKQLSSPLFGAQQLIENKLEELLINLIRNELNQNNNIKLVMSTTELENNLVKDIVAFLKENVYGRISLEDISRQTFYSKTYLNKIFQKSLGYTIMQYYTELKIQEAKKLLREGVSSNDIAYKLNFDSPTYFTKVFKRLVKLTPSQYRKTLL